MISESWFVENHPMIERLSRYVCRDARMTPADVEDFVSYAMLKLIENDYAVLRKYEGRAQLSSFLIVVLRRALSDYRTHERGKYRPSAEAQRLGPAAVELETLLRRDGRTLDEALRHLASLGRPIARDDAQRLAARFPERKPRPQHIAIDDEEASQVVSASDAESRVQSSERAATSATVNTALRDAIAELDAEDQTLLRLHFVAEWTVAQISRSLQSDQQRLYARLRRICRDLRGRLLGAGVDAERMNALLAGAEVDLDFGLQHGLQGGVQNPAARPSPDRERGGNDAKVIP